MLSGCAAMHAATERRFGEQVTSNVEYEYYTVTGSTATAILRSIRANGPKNASGRRVMGYTAWNVKWRYGKRSNHGLCRLANFRASADVTIWLPRWQPGHDAPEVLVHQWRQFISALEQHENQHRDNAIAAAHELVRELYGMSSFSCDALDRLAELKAEKILDRHQDWDREYDDETGHGLTEGARWPPQS